MTAEEFLRQLEQELSGLQKDERDNAMEYYREYFMESENEQEAVERLGSPQAAAQRIISEVGENGVYTPPKNIGSDPSSSSPDAGRIIMTICILFFTSPFWISLAIVWVALIFCVAVLLLSLGAAAVSAPVQGILEIVTGSPGVGLYDIGAGVLCAGLTMFLWKPVFLLIKAMSVGMIKAAGFCLNGMLGRRKNA